MISTHTSIFFSKWNSSRMCMLVNPKRLTSQNKHQLRTFRTNQTKSPKTKTRRWNKNTYRLKSLYKQQGEVILHRKSRFTIHVIGKKCIRIWGWRNGEKKVLEWTQMSLYFIYFDEFLDFLAKGHTSIELHTTLVTLKLEFCCAFILLNINKKKKLIITCSI